MTIFKTGQLRWWVLAIIAGMVLVAGLNAKKYSAVKTSGAVHSAKQLEFSSEEIITPQRLSLEQVLRVHGSLRAIHQASLKAKVAGEVLSVLVREGETVKAGQIVARIDALKAQLNVAQAESNMRSAQGQLAIALKNRDNYKLLVNQGFISTTAYQNAESQYVSAQANVSAYRAALDLARQAFNDTIVRAPIDGVVAARFVDPGEKVAVDTPLLHIADISTLELEAPVPAVNIEQIGIGQEVQIFPEGWNNPMRTRLLRINPLNQSGSRSYLIYAQLPNRDARLRAGLFAEVRIVTARKANALAIPKSALHMRNQQIMVYAIEQGRLVEKIVQTGFDSGSEAGMIEITQGLAENTAIVRNHLGDLAIGSLVRISTPSSPNPI